MVSKLQFENAASVAVGVFITLLILPHLFPFLMWVTSKGTIVTAFVVAVCVAAAWLSACKLTELMRDEHAK